jgi:hypothetical protein
MVLLNEFLVKARVGFLANVIDDVAIVRILHAVASFSC